MQLVQVQLDHFALVSADRATSPSVSLPCSSRMHGHPIFLISAWLMFSVASFTFH